MCLYYIAHVLCTVFSVAATEYMRRNPDDIFKPSFASVVDTLTTEPNRFILFDEHKLNEELKKVRGGRQRKKTDRPWFLPTRYMERRFP